MSASPDVQSQAPVQILISTEGRTPLALTVTPELVELLDLAASINRGSSEQIDLSFTSLIVGFYFGRHEISHWFQEYIAEQSVDFEAILGHRQLDRERILRLVQETNPETAGDSVSSERAATVSVRAWLEAANRIAHDQGHEWTGLRHVMAAVIFTTDFHAEEITQWGFDRRKWGESYLRYVARDLPDNVAFYQGLFDRTFPASPDSSQRLPFSNRASAILLRADQARSEQKKDRIYTEHLVLGLFETGILLRQIVDPLNVSLDSVLKQQYGVSTTKPLEYQGFTVSDNAHDALLKAAEKASTLNSPTLDENHLLFGVLSQSESQVVREMNRLGVLPDRVLFEDPASAHIATDSWTIYDALGHKEYSRAIYSFITDERTEAPLAISIQAPWGGGKTSLMRMVQQELDPGAIEKLESDRKKRRDRNQGIRPKVKPGTLKVGIGALTMTIFDVLKEISVWRRSARSSETVENPSVPPGALEGSAQVGSKPKKRRVTVWFNAWKYQNTEQVWAGLADCILRQVTDRMTVLDRQRFWLQLQLGRLDIDKIQRKIADRIVAEWWRVARLWIWGTLGMLLAGFEAMLLGDQKIRYFGISGSVLVGAAGVVKVIELYAKKRAEIGKEPAELTLSSYLQVPDYRSKVGFVHEVAEDLNRVMNSIPPEYLPIVVFIDDLDRCSPQKVAEVTEGINLFLAGEFPDCIFVLGMDAEMVAAALEKAHSDVIQKLPAYAFGIPVGWRFMDKFVQLPFVIPPPEPEDLTQYVSSLLKETGEQQLIPPDLQRQVDSVSQKSGTEDIMVSVAAVRDELKKHNLSETQKRKVGTQLKQAERLAKIDAEIARASRDDEVVREFVMRVAPDLYSNPRDLKRFLNTFRLHDFLRIAREGRGQTAPDRGLIADWIRLSLRWPQMVRWLHRITGEEHGKSTGKKRASKSHERLQEIEGIAGGILDSEGIQGWKKRILEKFGPSVADLDWASDPALYEFFRDMSQRPEPQRLSFGAGKGLW